MSEDESFDYFYSKLNEVVIEKFNLGEEMQDSKVVRKILRSLPESFRAKVTAIEKSKDLDEIKVQELIGFLQTYKLSLPNQRKSKSLALKTINEKVEAHGSSNEDVVKEDVVKKDVAYLAKNFHKFLKFKNNEKFGDKGNFLAFMTVAHVETLEDLVEELGEHSDEESMGIVEESDRTEHLTQPTRKST